MNAELLVLYLGLVWGVAWIQGVAVVWIEGWMTGSKYNWASDSKEKVGG